MCDKTNFSPSHCIEIYVPSKESGHSCICVEASILLLDFFTNIFLYSIKIYFGFRDVRSKHLEY